MRQHLAWPHVQPHPDGPPNRLVPPISAQPAAEQKAAANDERRQNLRDKLAVAAVLVLVLATVTVFVLYLLQQAPHFASGEFTGFATPVAAAAQATAADPANSVAGTGLSRVSLVLVSTVIEMGIFVALGLYLRQDTNRKP